MTIAQTVIHIVDDDASVRTAISRVLRTAGYDVIVYESAKHFLERLPKQAARGCILSDVTMPGLSGLELRKRLRELGSTLPIVFLTGSITALPPRVGTPYFLTKPITRETLLTTIERVIRQTS